MNPLDLLERMVASRGITSVHLGRSALASLRGADGPHRFCTLHLPGDAPTVTGQGDTCEQALIAALTEMGAPPESQPAPNDEADLDLGGDDELEGLLG